MGIVVASRQLAEASVQAVTLHSTVGGYELVFGLRLTVAVDADAHRRASIIGARVSVSSSAGEPQALGFARPGQPFEIVCKPYISSTSHTLHLYLQPVELAALETLRGTDELSFELLAQGTGFDGEVEALFQDRWHWREPRSDWIARLGTVGARNVLLLEIPLALTEGDDEPAAFRQELVKAEDRFRNGDYHGCIAACRIVIEEVGRRTHGPSGWSTAALEQVGRGDRRGMTKPEREAAIWAVLEHYAHLAHHGPAKGGSTGYTRADAQLLLSLVGAVVAHAESGVASSEQG